MTTPHDNDHDPTADLLARALRDEADRVETDPAALQRIQRRTAAASSGRSRWGWTLGALGAGLAAAAVITTVVVIADGQDDDGAKVATTPTPTDDAPSVTPMHEAVFDPTSTSNVTLYYVGVSAIATESGDREARSALYTEPHTVSDTTPLGAVREFLTSMPLDPDYASGWPEGVDVSSIETAGHETTIAFFGDEDVDLAALPDLVDVDTVDEDAARVAAADMAIQGLIRTAGITDGTVSFTYNGERLDTLLGADVAQGVEVLPELSSDFSVITRAAIQVTSPVEGQVVSSPVVVTGNGNVFEGNVNWQLINDKGREIDRGFVTSAMGEWADFEVELGTLAPGTYTFRAFESSGADGSEINVDDKTFTVQ
jgi:Immunoglobulin-like domain of bacterial spore germination